VYGHSSRLRFCRGWSGDFSFGWETSQRIAFRGRSVDGTLRQRFGGKGNRELVQKNGFCVDLRDGSNRVDAHFLCIRAHDPVEIKTRWQGFEGALLECLDFLQLDLRALRYLFC
jgi:hypothetical protein